MAGKLREKEIERERKRASTLQQQPHSCAHRRWWRWYFYALRFALIAVGFGMSFLWGLAALQEPPLSTNWNKQHNPSAAATVLTYDFSREKRSEAQANKPFWLQFWIWLLIEVTMPCQIFVLPSFRSGTCEKAQPFCMVLINSSEYFKYFLSNAVML